MMQQVVFPLSSTNIPLCTCRLLLKPNPIGCMYHEC
jgi:hypothetical protein